MNPFSPITSRGVRSSRRTRSKLTRLYSQVESLEERCLLSVVNPQTTPLLTEVEGTTVTNLEVARFETSTNGVPAPPIASIAFPAGTTTVASPAVTVTGAAVVYVPTLGTVTQWVVTVNSVTFTGATGVNQPHYVVGMQDPNDGSGGTSVQGTLQIIEAGLANNTLAGPTAASEGVPVSGLLLQSFTDGNLAAVPQDFKATVDWGDGTGIQNALITNPSPGNFNVNASHTYLKPGSYNPVVTITDTEFGGGSLNNQVGPVTVADPTLVPAVLPPVMSINTQVNAPLTNVLIGQFTDPNPLAKPSDFAAVVTNWGDGLSSGATVVETGVDGAGSHFDVLGSHIYTFPIVGGTITASVQDVNGTNAPVSLAAPTVNVTTAGLLVSAGPVNIVEGPTIPAGTLVGTVTYPDGLAAQMVNQPGFTITATATFTDSAGVAIPVALTPSATNGNTITFVTLAPVSATTEFDEGVSSFTLSATDNAATPDNALSTGSLSVADAALTPGATPGITATEGAAIAAATPVFAFSDGNTAATTADFTATINWGDGTPATTGTVVQNAPGLFGVQGGHTYAQAGAYTVSVTVKDEGGQTASGTIPAAIADATFTNSAAVSVLGDKNVPLVNVPVATFVDPNPLATPADINAAIAWGDATTTPGVVTELGAAAGGGVVFQVSGSHTYATSVGSPFHLSVAVTDSSSAGNTFTVAPTATISSSPIGVSVLPISTTVGIPTAPGQLVATFTDPAEANLTTLPGPITATINWGDGMSDNLGTGVTLQAMGGGVFGVIAPAGGHTYTTHGFYALTVTVNDSDPSSGIGGNLVIVAPGTITTAAAAGGTGVLAPGTEGAPLAANTPPPVGATGVELATFSSTDTMTGATGYTVEIDWGDGSPQSVGQVTPDLVANAADPTHAHFVVTGEHTYHEARTNPYTITVLISSPSLSGQSFPVLDSVTINDAILAGGLAVPISATEHVPLNDVAVATFTDPNPFGSAGDFSATINWGDMTGVDANARVVKTGGTAAGVIYTVYGSHTYDASGNFATEVTVQDEDGAVGSAIAVPPAAPPPGMGNVTVGTSPIVVTAAPLAPTVGVAVPAGTVVATFVDNNSTDPLTNYTATINWGDGTTQVFTPGQGITALGGGQFQVASNAAHTYNTSGVFAMTVTIVDSDPASGFGSSLVFDSPAALALTPPIVGPANPATATEGISQTFTLGTFTSSDPAAASSDFKVIVDWGDGLPESAATVTGAIGGPFTITGTHTYAEETTTPDTITLFLTDNTGGSSSATLNVNVNDAALSSGTSYPIFATEHIPLNDVPVATFVDANAGATAADFTATINWGDSSPVDANARVVLVGGSPAGAIFAVYGSHDYNVTTGSPFSTTVVVNDVGGKTTTITGAGNVTVGDSPIVVTAAPVTASAGVPVPVGTVLATFVDNNSADLLTNYSATANWGDGINTAAPTTIKALGGGQFEVLSAAPQTYTKSGVYTLTVTVDDVDPASGVGVSLVVVSPATITLTEPLPETPGNPATAVEGQPQTFNLGTFTSSDPTAMASDFTVTIDWGDGSPQSIALVTPDAVVKGQFDITAVHTYLEETKTPDTITVLVKDDTGASTVGQLLVNVNDATLSPNASAPIFATEHIPLNGVEVATFIDANPLATAADFTATINWGDGTGETAGTIALVGGTPAGAIFAVYGSHVYNGTTNSPFSTIVDVTDVGGMTTTVTGTNNVTVGDSPIVVSAQPLTTNVGVAIPAGTVLATFVDNASTDNLTNYSATVTWGDGPGTFGTTIKALGGGQFEVLSGAAHAYTSAGVFDMTVNVADIDPASGVGSAFVVVSKATLTLTTPVPQSPNNPATAVEGNSQTFTLGTFTSSNPGAALSDFSATVDWGDGTPRSTVLITPDPALAGVFDISGVHTYAEETTPGTPDTITILLKDNTGATTTGEVEVNVGDAALTPVASPPIFASEHQPLNNVVVATFSEANPIASNADFSVTINWGDGSALTSGTVAIIGGTPGSTLFAVYGSHVYNGSGPFSTEVVATDNDAPGGASVTITGVNNVTVNDTPIVVTAQPLTGGPGIAIPTGTVLATFVDNNSTDNLTNYSATANWGDGINTAAPTTIKALGGGQFEVLSAAPQTYTKSGVFNLTVTVNDIDPATGIGSSIVVISPATLTLTTPVPQTVNNPATAVEGVSRTFTLGTFTSSNPGALASDFTATVDWGDGTPRSTVLITPDPALAGVFDISGVHTYAEETTSTPDTVTIYLKDNTGASTIGEVEVNVNDAVLTAGTSYPINGPQSVPLNNIPVATFIDANPGATAADFTATINWGDGSSPTADPNTRIVLIGGSSAGAIFAVYGSHTYTQTGSYSTEVVVKDVGGQSTTIVGAGNVTIAQSPILVTGLPIGTFTIDAPTPVNLPVATFLDSGSSDPVSDYTATINWGDGSASQTFAAGQGIVPLGGGQFEFQVPVSHTYTNTGQFPITITINDTDPAKGVGGNLAIVIDSVITASPVVGPISAPGGGLYHEGQPLTNVALATLTDTDLTAQPTDYTVIIDWGDGSPQSAGTIVTDTAADAANPALAHFIIEGSHTYAETNLTGYKVQIIATDAFGGKTSTSVNIGISDAPLSNALGLPIYASEYGPLNDIPVATFVDANPLGSAGDFTATINWGDNSALDTNTRIRLVGANPNGPGLQYAVYGSHVYNKVGTFTTEITIQDEDPSGSSISTTPGTVTVAVAATPLVVSPAPVTATEGIALPNGQSIIIQNGSTPPTIVATFIDTSGPDPIGDYSVLIDWGNGSTAGTDTVTTGTIIQNGTGFEILAPVTTPIVYADEGNYTIRIALTDSNGGSTAYAIDPVTVADAKLTAGTIPTVIPTPVQGQPLPQTPGLVPPSTALGTFTDGNPLATPSDYTVTIDWGDGSPQSSGYVTQTGQTGTASGLFTVSGNHTYVNPSTGAGYPVTIYIKDDGGSTLTLTNFVQVSPSTITVTPQTFFGIEGQPIFNAVVAFFSDSGIPGPLSSYSAQINWNDASPPTITPGQIVPLGGDQFEVIGNLPTGYSEEGTFNVSVTINHNGVAVQNPAGGSTFTATAKIADAALTSGAIPIVATEGAPFSGAVAHFTDLDPNGTASDYTVTINWGDGTTSGPVTGAGITQTGGPGSPFLVSGNHTYHEEGTFTLTVTITDAGGATTTAAEQVTVGDAALVPANPQPTVTIGENNLFSGPVGTFQDLNPFSSLTDFTATIDWGDGSPNSVGTVQATSTPNVYQVVGTHFYANVGNTINGSPGSFAITTTVRDDGGSVVVLPNTANVTVVPIVAMGHLNPSSDTGKFNNDGITNDNQPDFFGMSAPFSHVRVYANAIGGPGGGPILLGTVQADSDGSWNIQSNVALPDGTYFITSTAQDQANLPVNPQASAVIVATNGGPNLLTIDTKGPRIVNTMFDRATGTIVFTFDDAGGSGVLPETIADAANYAFNNQLARPLGKYIVGAINVSPGPQPGEMTAFLTVESTSLGRPLPNRVLRGFFQITAISASVVDPSGIQDLAGNALDGEYYGPFSASGNGIPGGNFVANFNNFHNIINPPATVVGFPHPNDPPAGFTTKPTKNTHHASVVKPSASVLTVHDHALASVTVPKKKHH